MTWFRSHGRPAGWLALFALGLQLTLAFGHVHVKAAHSTTVAAATDAGGKAESTQPGSGEPPHADYCAICAVLTLLGGAQIACAPAVPSPVTFARAEIALTVEAARVVAPSAAFRSRAPPLG